MNRIPLTFKTSWLAKLVRQVPFSYQGVTLQLTKLSLHKKRKHEEITLSSIIEIERLERWLWATVHLSLSSGNTIVLGGLRRKDAKKIEDLIPKYKSALLDAIDLIKEKSSEITSFYKWLEERRNGKYWVSNHDIETALAKRTNLDEVLNLANEYLDTNPDIVKSISVIKEFFDDPAYFRVTSNKKFLPLELERFKDFFDNVERNPLTSSQRQAVITHEDNTRVIAGAGSGKTSVIVAKAKYLIEKGSYAENEILIIAFNLSAADELKERITNSIKANIRISTFHALGLSIMAAVENKKPSLAKTAETESALKQKIHDILVELVKDARTTRLITTYFQSFFAAYKNEFDFDNLGDYYKYIKDNDLITLNGEYLKSYEEVEIANFLCLNGVNYQYERQYPINTATVEHRQYEPDFYLPDYGIYIEHFGINRDGKTAPYINQVEYAAGINWKREVHKTHNTALIETYSYEKSEGILLENLETRLLDHGVEIQPIDPDEILEKLNSTNRVDPFTNLVVTFLNHFKGGRYSINDIRQQARDRGLLSDRLEAFLVVFQPIVEHYESYLSDNKVIDFNDMINNAVDYIEDRSYISAYKYILVDEFQDISTNRAALINALASQDPSHRLFCVGDDWQAIYRFAGSDISIMRDFSSHFGFTETVALDRTFRFNDRIEEVATRFILKNPSQIKKSISAQQKANGPRVFLHRPGRNTDDIFMDVLREIDIRSGSGEFEVLCLGRYNFSVDGLSWSKAESEFPNLNLKFKTVHSAKGMEADYTVVLGMRSGKYGFPSEVTDDPILDAVLSEPENYTHAEERRLFYVALTRARYAVHLVVDYSSPSSFVSEIRKYAGLVASIGAAGVDPVNCPSCQTGELMQRTSQYGNFYGCQNYPLCVYKVEACAKCGYGLLVHDNIENHYMCNNESCHHIERPCPRCKDGRLVERTSKHGSFYGCTNYHSNQCKYTEHIYLS